MATGHRVGHVTSHGSFYGRALVQPVLVTDGADAGDKSSYAFPETASPAANTLLILAVTCSHASAAEVPNSVSGYGLTWTQCVGTASGTGTYVSGQRRVTTFYAWGASPTPGSVTVGFATGHTSCVYSVTAFPGAALVANLQSTTNTLVGTTITGTLLALENAANVHFYALGRSASEATTPPAAGGWSEWSDRTTGGSPAGAQETASAINDTTADPTWTTSGGTCIVSLELKAA